jgi:serine/threonine-protein kinase
LLAGALDGPPPTHIADYEILEQLGRGGMGVIYRARHQTIGHVVALKVIRAGELASDEERRRFVAEVKAAAALAHPNIVPVYGVGEQAGCPFFTMPVFPSTLRDRMDHRLAPGDAAALIATVARAVQHAHERGVLHRDLKPENILVDAHGQPHVADFSVAKRIGEPGLTEPGVIIGTRAYMAPEQARGDGPAITTAADQYSLGIVLYELLTGELPFDPQAAREAALPPPRSLVPIVPRDLEAVCLKCIAREPGERYGSVAELADDLERIVRGEPPAAGPANFAARTWRLARRHKLAVAASAATIVLLVIIAASAVLVARAQEHSALQANAFAAEALSGEVASYLQAQIGDVVKLASNHPVISSTLASEQNAAVWLTEARKYGNTQFENVWLFDTEGRLIAQTDGPKENPHKNIGKDYCWRDYFQGATHLVRSDAEPVGYVARAVQSEADDRYKFAISAPFYDADRRWRGVVVANIATSPTAFESARLVGHDGRKANAKGDTTVAVLVAPQDRSRDDAGRKDTYVVTVHDGIKNPGDGVRIDAPALRQFLRTRRDTDQLVWTDRSDRLPITSDDYHDPLPEWSESRRLAAFAPVAHTGFVVIVQTRYDAWVTTGLLYPLIGVLAAAILAWAAAFITSLWHLAGPRERQTPRTLSPPAAVTLEENMLLSQ